MYIKQFIICAICFKMLVIVIRGIPYIMYHHIQNKHFYPFMQEKWGLLFKNIMGDITP